MNENVLGQVVERIAGRRMPLEDLVAERGDDVGLDGVGGSLGELVVGLDGGDHLILEFSVAVGGVERVDAHPRHVGAIAGGALLDQHLTASGSSAERVGSVARAHNSVL